MNGPGAVLLAGGRSTRMGSAKADLDWHGVPLVLRVAGLLLRAVPGPVVVVRAASQPLPSMPARVSVADDPEPGLGPLAGLGTGLAALAALGVDSGFACSTDQPFMHPALVRAVLHRLDPDPNAGPDAVAPELDGRLQPLAAAYRTRLAAVAAGMVQGGERRATALLLAVDTARLDRHTLLADPALAAADPDLRSLLNLNHPEEYRTALALPPPAVTVLRPGVGPAAVRAYTLGTAVTQDAALTGGATATVPPDVVLLNGTPVPADPDLPLLAGDVLTL
jgi:molybdenum cofactor guanylyltransferase